MRLTAQEVYDKLINEDQILTLQGQIRFFLGDVNIIVKQRDVVGNIMQEWLQGWLDARGIEYLPSENSQMPPDFFLNPDDNTRGLLEVKAFNRSGSPGFDIADFRMYAEEILEKPYMLDVDYLIFGYEMSDEGVVTIRDVWLKKVWQITRRMEDFAINLQVKDGVIHKIRPAVWYSEGVVDYSCFNSLEDFISAMDDTVYREPRLRDTIAATWLSKFQRNYRARYGRELDVPRWNTIKDDYDLVTVRRREQAIANLNTAQERVNECNDRINSFIALLEIANTEKKIADLQAKIERARERLAKAEIKRQEAQEKYDLYFANDITVNIIP